MSRRLGTLLIWLCVAASAVFWSLRLLADPLPVPESARLASVAAAPGGDWSRLLGAAPRSADAVAAPPPPAASRFRLVGVAAAAGPGQVVEVALIAVDAQPARTFRLGQMVADDWRLTSVDRRGATLAPVATAGAPLVLEMPPPTPAATGVVGSLLPPVPAPPAPPPVAPGVVAPAAASSAPGVNPPPPANDLRQSPLAR